MLGGKEVERRAARLYSEAALQPGALVEATPGQAHHLRNVLRLQPGATVGVFNARDGEWLCRIAEIGRARTRLAVERPLRGPQTEADLWLLFAPIKRARLDWVVEKATELGVAAVLPVWTARTQAGRVNLERLRAHAVAAAEQCGRLSVPEVRAPEPLDSLLTAWPAGRRLFVCDETGAGAPAATALSTGAPGPAAILVGPEGGFTETELDALGKLPFVSRIGLGPLVLRAETAAVACLAAYQAIAGDWRRR